MTCNIRPTVTKWGPYTARFLDMNPVDDLMRWIADQVGCELEVEERKSGFDYWFSDGLGVVNFLATRDPETVARESCDDPEEAEQCRLLFQNFRNLTSAWRQWIADEGSLTLFVDAF